MNESETYTQNELALATAIVRLAQERVQEYALPGDQQASVMAVLAVAVGKVKLTGNDFEIRGELASELKCWHRLTGEEAVELVAFVSALKCRVKRQNLTGEEHGMDTSDHTPTGSRS